MQTSRAPVPPSPASNTPTLDCRSPKNLKCKGASSNELNCAKDGQQAEHNTVFVDIPSESTCFICTSPGLKSSLGSGVAEVAESLKT